MNKRDWWLSGIPIAVSLVLVAIVATRIWLTDGGGDAEPSAVTSDVGAPRIADAPPVLPLDEEVGRSQLIVVGNVGDITSYETIPPVGMEANAPSATEPAHGVPTTLRPVRVERYIKGNGAPGDVITMQELAGSAMPSGRAILFLAPWMTNTYQPSVTASLSETKKGLVYADGTSMPELASTSLDQYSGTLANLVARQAASGAKVELAVPPPSPGDEVSLNHLLGTRSVTNIAVRIGNKQVTVNDAGTLAKFADGLDATVKIEREAESMESAPVHLVLQLAGGNSWEFEYDPATGVIAYPAAALQATLPKAASALLNDAAGLP